MLCRWFDQMLIDLEAEICSRGELRTEVAMQHPEALATSAMAAL